MRQDRARQLQGFYDSVSRRLDDAGIPEGPLFDRFVSAMAAIDALEQIAGQDICPQCKQIAQDALARIRQTPKESRS